MSESDEVMGHVARARRELSGALEAVSGPRPDWAAAWRRLSRADLDVRDAMTAVMRGFRAAEGA